MKRTLSIISSVFLFALPAAADPIEGLWQTLVLDDGSYGHVEITPCNDGKFCGRLVRGFRSDGQTSTRTEDDPNIGRYLVWDMEPLGNGEYGGGKIYAPDRDKTYNGQMILTGDRLTVKGCVLFVCRDGGTWARVR